MAAPSSDDDMIAQARQKVGAQNATAIPRRAIRKELDDVKARVATEVTRALERGTISLYDSDAPLEMAKHLLYLRVAEQKRQQRPNAPETPTREIPRSMGEIRRADFDDPTLRYWRDELIRNRNRITED